jgi:peptidoglycan/xylan/chitin deacetylase (PgdA/CDA1 family)
MLFKVTYRLTHPEYLPTLSHTTLSAQTHQQLDEAITKLVRKWEAQGYTLRILAVRKRHRFRQTGA